MRSRIVATCILVFALIFTPFWLLALLVFGGMIYFSHYWEGVLVLLCSDLLHATQMLHFENFVLVSFSVSVVILSIIELLKKNTRTIDYAS